MANTISSKWCFTVNAGAQEFYDNLETLFQDQKTTIKYICGQLETAATGQLHFQGYVQLKRSQRLSWLKNNIDDGAHFEKQQGTNAQAREYCMKEDTSTAPFIDFGIFIKGRGQRTDLADFKNAIAEGQTKRDLLDTYINELARYPKFYDMVRSCYRPTRTVPLKVRLNIGPTGTGKTRYAYDNFPDLFDVPVTNGSLWFDGYDNHKVVLLDDFAGAASKISLVYTLRMLDRYPIQLPVKGSHVWWMPEQIIVTSNIHPRDWYKWEDRQGQYDALLRRITEVWYYDTDRPPLFLEGANLKKFKNNTNDVFGFEYPDDSTADTLILDESSDEDIFDAMEIN